MLADGRAALLVQEPFGNFFDAQARALLHGHWNVSPSQLAFEGFRIHGKTYTYFGPWPSVLRMPFLELAPSTYGRLTRLSMFLAFATLMAGIVALHWRIRGLFRAEAPLSRGETIVAVAVPIVVGCGSSMLFLAGRAWVYHEAILWGVAWATVSYERILAFMRSPSGARLAVASLTATLAFSSRASVGVGPVVALGLVFVSRLVRAVRAKQVRSERGWILGTLGAVLVPAVSYMYVNWSRFGSFFTVPWSRQVLFSLDAAARRPLAANGGSYFSLKFVPTTFLAYLRPDALSRNSLFPWVTFPRSHPPVIGKVLVVLDLTSSVPASMPALTLLAVVGITAACSWRFARTRDARVLRVPLIGAGVGVFLTLSIGFVSERYVSDWVPLLALGGLTGIHALLHRRRSREPGRSRRASTALLALVAVLAVSSLWINGSLALLYERLYNPAPESLRTGMLGFQYAIDRAIGGGASESESGPDLRSQPVKAGTTAIVGDCAALYWSDGQAWRIVEGSPAGGVIALRAELPPPDATAWRPLVSWVGPNGPDVIALRRHSRTLKVSRAVRLPDGSLAFSEFSSPFRFGSGRSHTIDIVVSRPLQLVRVEIDGAEALYLPEIHDLPTGAPTVGAADAVGVAPTYGAPIHQLPADIRLCGKIRRASR